MHGLIFVTWEKYLSERFKGSVLNEYRDALGGTQAPVLLASRVYDDEILLAGVAAASRITSVPAERLLREFGRYFMTNGLTRHLCAYILTQVHSGRDLLLAMHDSHEQMSRLPEGLTPPLFQYTIHPQQPDALTLVYDSPRKLCPVLIGAVEGAAERYGEQVHIVEQTCMKRGDLVCRFKIRFSASTTERLDTREQMERQQEKQQFAQFILSLLPDQGGVTLLELQKILALRGIKREWTRPALLLEALHHLHHAGLVATTANHAGDDLMHRRYWRAPTSDSSSRDYLRFDGGEHVHY
jgi:Haem-NO-binding